MVSRVRVPFRLLPLHNFSPAPPNPWPRGHPTRVLLPAHDSLQHARSSLSWLLFARSVPLLIHPWLVFLTAMSTNSASATSGAMGNLTTELIVIIPYAMIAVCSHVLVVLELKHPNFHKWAPFKFFLGKFGLRGHIDDHVSANPNDPQWIMDDSCLRPQLASRIYCCRCLGPCHGTRSIGAPALGHHRGPLSGQQGAPQGLPT